MKSPSDCAAMRRKRHKWNAEPVRLEFETIRACVICDLRKITDHTVHPPVLYYLEKASNERLAVMPECEVVT